jgi:sarcosine oxidase, subunit beta
MDKNYDVIVIGAGSVGAPISFYLSKEKIRVLTIEAKASVGQASNKSAIGGIRATHSDFSKITLCKRSIELFANWKEQYGDEIEWYQGGYVFPVYEKSDETNLKTLVVLQKDLGLNINWLDKKDLVKIIPDINSSSLLGGTYSPEDGSASPLLCAHSFYSHASENGADFLFGTRVQNLHIESGMIKSVFTNQGVFYAPLIINAAGAWAADISKMTGVNLPVNPDSHEAGITEPVSRFLQPMVVDVRPFQKSANFYFYQHITGQIIFCVTPLPNVWGFDTDETSEFLPLAARRMIEIMPRLKHIRVRRTWRGLYPMTPDGLPIIGFSPGCRNLLMAAGMCGQGFMLGPGLAELVSRIILCKLTTDDKKILHLLSPDRNFDAPEMLK